MIWLPSCIWSFILTLFKFWIAMITKKQINVITKYKWCETGSGCCKMQKTNLFTDQSDKFTKSAVCCGWPQSTCLPPELQWHKELLAELTINSASFESTWQCYDCRVQVSCSANFGQKVQVVKQGANWYV